MTDFGQKFPLAFGICAFGVAGCVSILVGAEVLTAFLRAFTAGFVFFVFGQLIAYALLYNPDSLPANVAKSQEGIRAAMGGMEKKEKKEAEVPRHLQ